MAPASSRFAMAPGHAAERAMERYGLNLTVADFRWMALDITDAVLGLGSKAHLHVRLSDGSEQWFVEARGIALRVAYDPSSATIVSVLPMTADHAARCRAAGIGVARRIAIPASVTG